MLPQSPFFSLKYLFCFGSFGWHSKLFYFNFNAFFKIYLMSEAMFFEQLIPTVFVYVSLTNKRQQKKCSLLHFLLSPNHKENGTVLNLFNGWDLHKKVALSLSKKWSIMKRNFSIAFWTSGFLWLTLKWLIRSHFNS